VFKEKFEAAFPGHSIPVANATRWNSMHRQLQCSVHLDSKKLADVCADEFSHVNLLSKDMAQLSELCDLLALFLEAIDLTQGEKSVTISLVVPCILSLRSHLRKAATTVKHCQHIVNNLTVSSKKRFRGIFVRVGMESTELPCDIYPFQDKIYFIAAIVDPRFSLCCISVDVSASSDTRERVHKELTALNV